MSRALVVVRSPHDRRKVFDWASKCPVGTRIEFKGAKRTLPQNDRMWAMLTDIAQQKEHVGRKYPTDVWKCIFMSALGQEMVFVPSLDEKGVIPLGHRSSEFSVEEMSGLIEMMFKWGAENGVVWSDPSSEARAA